MDHPFEVGNIYKNRQGPYEVVYLNEQANKMIIRYLDTGEEVEISISIQARIWRNIGWDEQARAQEREAAEARYQQGYGKDFSGLIDSDFKTNTEGTTWRSRRGLAGSLAQYLSADTPYTFVSWAIYGWPVAFLTHREDYQMAAFEMGSRKAKFMIDILPAMARSFANCCGQFLNRATPQASESKFCSGKGIVHIHARMCNSIELAQTLLEKGKSHDNTR